MVEAQVHASDLNSSGPVNDPITNDIRDLGVIQESLTETDLISGIVETVEIANRVHILTTAYSIALDTLIDNGSARTLIRRSVWDKISEISGRELDVTNNPRIIMANGLTDTVVGKVNLPITTDDTTKMCEVRVVTNLDTEMILSLDSQGKFDMVFASRSKTVFMLDSTGRRYPLKH